jgi:GT2 family glycosyltransferase
VIAFVDADCRPSPGWLRHGFEAIASADLVQGAVHAVPTPDAGPFDRTVWVTSDHGLFQTASLFVRRATFDEVGGFQDWIEADLAVPFGEDVWFGWRARRAGARVAFSAEALVHHAVFARDWRGFVDEHRRRAHFPALVARIPELRGAFLWRHWFLSRRSALFDCALVGLALAAALRSRWPLLALLPYAVEVARDSWRWRTHVPAVAAVQAIADCVSFIALVRGSLRHNAAVL